MWHVVIIMMRAMRHNDNRQLSELTVQALLPPWAVSASLGESHFVTFGKFDLSRVICDRKFLFLAVSETRTSTSPLVVFWSLLASTHYCKASNAHISKFSLTIRAKTKDMQRWPC